MTSIVNCTRKEVLKTKIMKFMERRMERIVRHPERRMKRLMQYMLKHGKENVKRVENGERSMKG